MKKLIMFEFNELCPHLIQRFMDNGDLPNFSRLHEQSRVGYTEAAATDYDLNPWVQWVDVHTGKPSSDHDVRGLNQGNAEAGSYIWDVLARKHGLRSWICGSMNAGYGEDFKGRLLPDPWSTDIRPFPHKEMDDGYRFIANAVQNHSSGSEVSAFKAIPNLLKMGLSIGTCMKLAAQVIAERFKPSLKWRRAMAMDWIQADIFLKYYEKERPEFATFFSNSSAHYQHHYWKDYEPDLFEDANYAPSDETQDAIRQSYINNDRILGKILKQVPADTAVVFATALSQQPYTDNVRYFYHINDEQNLRTTFNIPADMAYKPIMAEQFYLDAPDEDSARALAAELSKYHMVGEGHFFEGSNDELFFVTIEESRLRVQCGCQRHVVADATFRHIDTGERFNFYDHFYKMQETKAGVHNPVGAFWFKVSAANSIINENLRVAPSQIFHEILNYFEMEKV